MYETRLGVTKDGIGAAIRNVFLSALDFRVVEYKRANEPVVDGRIVPDTYVVDKVQDSIIEKQTGSKQLGVWLSDHGGTVEKENVTPQGTALSDGSILQVAELAAAGEDHFGMPQDIEWAYESGELYLLQSRPVTGYIGLPREFVTEPGEWRILYQDGLVAGGCTRISATRSS